MGAVIAESLAAPLDYFLPARILEVIQKHFPFPSAFVLLQDPHTSEHIPFAGTPFGPKEHADYNGSFPLGSVYQLNFHGLSNPEKSLSFLAASIGSRVNASRPIPFSHSLPKALPLIGIAKSIAARHRDSLTRFATLCVLDTLSYTHRLSSTFPLMNRECLQADVIRAMSYFFEAAGGLYLSESGEVISLSCASMPTDTELLQLQLVKFLRRFISASVDPNILILHSRLFEASESKSMEDFLLNASGDAP